MNLTKLILLAGLAAMVIGCSQGADTQATTGTKTAPTTEAKSGKPGGGPAAAAQTAALGPGAADADNRLGSKAK